MALRARSFAAGQVSHFRTRYGILRGRATRMNAGDVDGIEYTCSIAISAAILIDRPRYLPDELRGSTSRLRVRRSSSWVGR